MGAKGFTIFRRITLPQMKWGLIYGIILCTARALGEFGAVNALSKTRGGHLHFHLRLMRCTCRERRNPSQQHLLYRPYW